MITGDCGIIVVDDDVGMSRAISRMLTVSGWSSKAFASAEELLDSAELESASLLIVDIQLPGISGLELHERLRDTRLRLPVIFITGRDRPCFRERALKAGAVAYLTKPFPGQDLIDAVRRLLDQAGIHPNARS
jgi:FixJ family two-component response regulator